MSVRNVNVIKGFGGGFVLPRCFFYFSVGVGGFCHRTESDLFVFSSFRLLQTIFFHIVTVVLYSLRWTIQKFLSHFLINHSQQVARHTVKMANAERVRTRSKWYIVCSILNNRVLFIHPSVQLWTFECLTLNTEALNFHHWILMSFYVRMWTHSELHWPFVTIIWYLVDIAFNKAIKISLHLIWQHTHWFRNITKMK